MTIYLAVNATMPLKAEDIAVMPPGAVAALYARLALELPHQPGFAPDVLRSLRGDYYVTAATPSAAGDMFIAATQKRVRDVPAGAQLSLDPCGGTVCVPTAHGHLCRPTFIGPGGQEWGVDATFNGTVYRARPYIRFDVVETQPLEEGIAMSDLRMTDQLVAPKNASARGDACEIAVSAPLFGLSFMYTGDFESLGVEVDGKPSGPAAILRRGREWKALLFNEPLPSGAALRIRSASALSIASPRAMATHDIPLGRDRGATPVRVGSVTDVMTLEEYVAARSRTLMSLEQDSIERGIAEDRRHIGAMWWALDNATSTTFLGDKERCRHSTSPWPIGEAERVFRIHGCGHLMGWLTRRTAFRASVKQSGRSDAEIRHAIGRIDPGLVTPAMLDHIGLVIRSVFERKLSGDDETLAKATGHFAAGTMLLEKRDLPRSTWTAHAASSGSPNSCAICLFPELALAMLESGSAPAFWVRMLRSFVAMLRTFRCAFGDGAAAAAEEWNLRCATMPRNVVATEQILAHAAGLGQSVDELEASLNAELVATVSGEFCARN